MEENNKKSFKEWAAENKEKIIKVTLTILGTVAGAAVVAMLVKGSGEASDLIDVDSVEISDGEEEVDDDSTEESEE